MYGRAGCCGGDGGDGDGDGVAASVEMAANAAWMRARGLRHVGEHVGVRQMRCTSGEGGDGEDGGEAAIRDGCGEAASAVEAALRVVRGRGRRRRGPTS